LTCDLEAFVSLHDNQISDISPLANLTKLIRLWLYNNEISDISPLVNLVNLDTLSLQNNFLDISPGSAALGVISGLQAQGTTVTYETQNTVGLATLTVPLFSGWNWVSCNVTPEDASIGAVLQGYTLSDYDVIKGQEGSATYFGGQWFLSSPNFELETGLLYKILKQSAGDESFEVTGQPADPSATIDLVSGSNWIGVNLQESAEIEVLAHSGGFLDNDTIKGQEGSATFFGGQWFPSSESFRLKPGKGYLLNTANPGQLTFDNVISGSQALDAGKSKTVGIETISAPDWEAPTGFQNSMIIFAQVDSNGNLVEADGSLLAAFAGEEIRGVARIGDGPAGKLFQLNVFSNSAAESDLSLRVFDPNNGIFNIVETFNFESDGFIGGIATPQLYNTESTPIPPPIITAEPENSEIASGNNVVLSVTATGDGLTYQWYVGQSGDTSNPIQDATNSTHDTGALTVNTAFWVRVTNTGGPVDSATADITVIVGLPIINAQPVSERIDSGGSTTMSITAEGDGLSYQWYEGPSGDTSQPIADTDRNFYTTPALTETTSYWVRVTNAGGSVDSITAVISVSGEPSTEPNANVVDGFGFSPDDPAFKDVVNIFNEYVLDLITITGPLVTFRADPDQIARAIYVDENDDIVHVDFFGSGTCTVIIDPNTFRDPEAPVKYFFEGVKYVKGRARIIIEGAESDTYSAIFTLGSLSAEDPEVILEATEYDGIADVTSVTVTGTAMGGMIYGNVRFSGSEGDIGILAEGVQIIQQLTVMDIDASGSAVPHLLVGQGSALLNEDELLVQLGVPEGALGLAAGDLQQTNSAGIRVADTESTAGFGSYQTRENFKSDGTELPAVPLVGTFENALSEVIVVPEQQ